MVMKRAAFPLILTGVMARLKEAGFNPSIKLDSVGNWYVQATEDIRIVHYYDRGVNNRFTLICAGGGGGTAWPNVTLRHLVDTVTRMAEVVQPKLGV